MNPVKEHLIYIEADDELSDLFSKIEDSKGKKLRIIVPRRATLLHSLVNIKMLKRRLDKEEKNAIFVSNDETARQLLNNAGLDCEENPEEITPVQKGTTVAVHWWNRWRQKIRTYLTEEEAPKNAKKGKTNKYQFILNRPNSKYLILLVTVSVLLLVLILYLALPSATIYIKPNINLKKSSLNITLADSVMNSNILMQDRVVATFPLETEFEKRITVGSTGQNFIGARSRGTVTLINTSDREWPIIANSRLQTPNGLVYLTDNFVTVPARGSANVSVTARDKDNGGKFIGSRGNIGASRLILPGLSDYNQKLIYGQTEGLNGGTDDMEKFVQKDDLSAARSKIEAELKYYAKNELLKKLNEIESQHGKKYRLLDFDARFINTEVIKDSIVIPQITGQKVGDFEVSGKLRVKGIYYDEEEVRNILLANLQRHLHSGQKLIKVKDDSIVYNDIVFVDEEKKVIKITASLEGIITSDFFNKQNNLAQTLREMVLQKTKKEAENLIANRKEVSEVHISVWPLWTPTLPAIPDNITIKVEDVE